MKKKRMFCLPLVLALLPACAAEPEAGSEPPADETYENLGIFVPGAADYHDLDGIDRSETSGGVILSGTYETVQDYIDALNGEKTWVIYDSAANTATITSIADFVSALKIASKDLGAFDALDASQGENILFGYGDGSGAHFDAIMASLLVGTDYETAYANDLERTDDSTTNFIAWVVDCCQ